jgi:hypothetical protein
VNPARILAPIAVALAGCSSETPASPSASDAGLEVGASAALGASAAQARMCGQCHQSSDPESGVLSGQDMPVQGSSTYGSNLTPDPDTGLDAWDAGTIAMAILLGTGVEGRALCPEMPRYADAGMSTGEAQDIAAYLQGLPPVWHAVPRSVCPP